ncbi:hypothetical protein C0883_02545 [Campylobacter lari]|nr:hypothetical protein [Campylobacter lari]
MFEFPSLSVLSEFGVFSKLPLPINFQFISKSLAKLLPVNVIRDFSYLCILEGLANTLKSCLGATIVIGKLY